LDNILVDTNTPDLLLAASCRALNVRGSLDISTSLGILARTDRVFLVIDNVKVDAQGSSREESGDGWLEASALGGVVGYFCDVLG
jgi:hypothetical protein